MDFQDRRLQAESISGAYSRLGFESYADRILTCASFVSWEEKIPIFLDEEGLPDEGYPEFRLVDANFCRVRHCPICQWRRASRWKAKFRVFRRYAEKKVIQRGKTPRWLFLTLTMRNCLWEELHNTVVSMNQSFNSRSFARSRRFLRSFYGWIRSLEVTRGTFSGWFHPHFHALLLTDEDYFSDEKRYYSQDRLVDMWGDALGVNYRPGAHIRAIKGEELDKSLPEVFKYQVKPDDLVKLNDEELNHLTLGLHGVHAINRAGLLRNCKIDENNLIGKDNNPSRSTGRKVHQSWDFQNGKYDYQLIFPNGYSRPIEYAS